MSLFQWFIDTEPIQFSRLYHSLTDDEPQSGVPVCALHGCIEPMQVSFVRSRFHGDEPIIFSLQGDVAPMTLSEIIGGIDSWIG